MHPLSPLYVPTTDHDVSTDMTRLPSLTDHDHPSSPGRVSSPTSTSLSPPQQFRAAAASSSNGGRERAAPPPLSSSSGWKIASTARLNRTCQTDHGSSSSGALRSPTGVVSPKHRGNGPSSPKSFSGGQGTSRAQQTGQSSLSSFRPLPRSNSSAAIVQPIARRAPATAQQDAPSNSSVRATVAAVELAIAEHTHDKRAERRSRRTGSPREDDARRTAESEQGELSASEQRRAQSELAEFMVRCFFHGIHGIMEELGWSEVRGSFYNNQRRWRRTDK